MLIALIPVPHYYLTSMGLRGGEGRGGEGGEGRGGEGRGGEGRGVNE